MKMSSIKQAFVLAETDKKLERVELPDEFSPEVLKVHVIAQLIRTCQNLEDQEAGAGKAEALKYKRMFKNWGALFVQEFAYPEIHDDNEAYTYGRPVSDPSRFQAAVKVRDYCNESIDIA